MNLHDSQKVLDGYLDEQRVVLHCATHNYAGPGSKVAPKEGCPKCAHVMLYTIIARQSGDKQDAIGQLEDIIHALVELDEEGAFDYKPQPLDIKTETLED